MSSKSILFFETLILFFLLFQSITQGISENDYRYLSLGSGLASGNQASSKASSLFASGPKGIQSSATGEAFANHGIASSFGKTFSKFGGGGNFSPFLGSKSHGGNGYGGGKGGFVQGAGSSHGTGSVYGSGSSQGHGSIRGSGSVHGYGSSQGAGSSHGAGYVRGSGSFQGSGSGFVRGAESSHGYGSVQGDGSVQGAGSVLGSGFVRGAGSANGYGSGSFHGYGSVGGFGAASGFGSASSHNGQFYGFGGNGIQSGATGEAQATHGIAGSFAKTFPKLHFSSLEALKRPRSEEISPQYSSITNPRQTKDLEMSQEDY